MDAATMRRKLVERINRLRRVNRILESESFQEVWKKASPPVLSEIEALIHLGYDDKLEILIEKHEPPLEELSVRKLRNLARDHLIPYYGNKSKPELIEAIRDADQQRKGRSSEDGGSGLVQDSGGGMRAAIQ